MNFKFFLIKLTLAFAFGSALFFFIANNIQFKNTSTPWIMLTLLLIPSGYCVQAFFKLPEADEHPSLTNDELRRLRPIIKTKKNRLSLLFFYYLFSATTVAVGFFSVSTKTQAFEYVFILTGGLLISSLYSFVFIRDNMDELQRFKSILIHRSDAEKKKKELLEKISKKPD
ncbi:hypothetical protein [Atlantibacter hermannii]|uniref:hypothetical protein n=1 Tax=Atlantibacter hermannii TaxID=565 RepID=UPI0028991BDA|nr:hypothetical protein [Atlantibacter hermannii]